MAFDITKVVIDKSIPIPLYYQLKSCIYSQINAGAIEPGDIFPTEFEFVNVLGISRSTVRQAFNDLVNEGYIYREKSKGTFFAPPKIDELFLKQLDSFNQEMQSKGLEPSTEVLDLKTISAQDRINKKLGLGEHDELIYLSRLRYASKEPVVFLETYLPATIYHGLLDEDFRTQSLYSLLEEKYRCRVNRAVRKIEAVPADAAVAGMFVIKPNAPIFLVKTVAYSLGKIPVEYSVARYRGDRNTFTVELTR